MSPLAPNANQTVAFINETNNGTDNLISTMPSLNQSKIEYTKDELLNLQNVKIKLATLIIPSTLNEIVRVNLMPAFSVLPHHFIDNHNAEIKNRAKSFQRQSSQSSDELDHPSNNRQRFRHCQRNNENVPRSNDRDVQIRLCIKEDVKLHRAKNAWKPSVMIQKTTNENDEITELFRQVRSILNKLTIQNFDVMLNHFKSLQIDTATKLDGVIDLVFDKAVNEPHFSIEYARFCKHLSNCSEQIPVSPTETAFFKRTFITKCQHEFEQHVAMKNSTECALIPLNEKLKACSLNNDSNKCNEIKSIIVEEESNIRRRLVSTVRFIGELYKLDMLTTNIMDWCIDCLLRSKTEEKLECACKLLKTVGAKLERKPVDDTDQAKKQYLDLSKYMVQFRVIVNAKNPNQKVSSRIKFMLMDVLELRAHNWIPIK